MTDQYYVSLDDYFRNELVWMASCSHIPKYRLVHGLVSDGLRVKDMRDILQIPCTQLSEKERDESMARFIEFLPKFLSLEEEFDEEDVDFFTDEIIEHLIALATYILDKVLPSLGIISEPEI
jgi:hypothetical protein